jgi:predicted nucleic acid-binding protein
VTIGELCTVHRRIGLDTNILVYLLEDVAPLAASSQAIMDAVEARRVSAVLASIGLAELVTGPARSGDGALVEWYADELRSMAGLRIEPLSADIAVDAAIIRGSRRIGLADAIHLATARAAGATAFITNDRSLRGSTKLEVVYVDDLEVEPPAA